MLNNNTVSLKNVFDFFLSRSHMKCESENEKKICVRLTFTCMFELKLVAKSLIKFVDILLIFI